MLERIGNYFRTQVREFVDSLTELVLGKQLYDKAHALTDYRDWRLALAVSTPPGVSEFNKPVIRKAEAAPAYRQNPGMMQMRVKYNNPQANPVTEAPDKTSKGNVRPLPPLD